MSRTPRRWPLILLALPAAVATWSGWVGLGEKTGFGVVKPLPGISDVQINTATRRPRLRRLRPHLPVWRPGRLDPDRHPRRQPAVRLHAVRAANRRRPVTPATNPDRCARCGKPFDADRLPVARVGTLAGRGLYACSGCVPAVFGGAR